MSPEKITQNKLDQAIQLISLAMPGVGARFLKSSHKEKTINFPLNFQSDADISKINSVILMMEDKLISGGISVVKLYRSLEGQSNPECFSTLELNHSPVAVEENPFSDQSSSKTKTVKSQLDSSHGSLKQKEHTKYLQAIKNPVYLALSSFIVGMFCGWAATPKLPASPIAEYIPVTLPPQSGEITPTAPPPGWDPILDERFQMVTSNPEDCPKYAFKFERDLIAIYDVSESEDFKSYMCILTKDRKE